MRRAEELIQRAEKIAPLSDDDSPAEFVAFYDQCRDGISDMLRDVKRADGHLRAFALRAGMMPPERSVISAEIQRLCEAPYRTTDGTNPSCPGMLRGLKGCPPHAPSIAETRQLLSRARGFLIVQLEGHEGDAQQGRVHALVSRTRRTLGQGGYEILDKRSQNQIVVEFVRAKRITPGGEK